MTLVPSIAHAHGVYWPAPTNLFSVTCVCNCRFLISRCLSSRAEFLATVCKSLGDDFSRTAVEQDCLNALPLGTTRVAPGKGSKPCHRSLCGMALAAMNRIHTSLHMPEWDFLPMSKQITEYLYMSCTMRRTHKTIEHPFGTHEAGENGKTSRFLIALDPNTGEQAACTSVAGDMHHIVCIKSGIGLLLTTSNKVLCLWSVAHQRTVWEHRFEDHICAITCPHNDIVVCIVKNHIVGLKVETGSLSFSNDVSLTTPRDTDFHCGRYEGNYEGARYEGVVHSKDMMFITFLQVYSLDHDPYHEENPGGIDEEDLWVVAIDLQTGREVWARNEDADGPMSPQLQYSESAALVFLMSYWCCYPSAGQFFAYDSLTGHRVMSFDLREGVPRMKVVGDLVVFLMDHEGLSSSGDDQEQEHRIVVKKCTDCGPSSGELFRITSDEYIADFSLVHDRFLCWVTYTGSMILIDMLDGRQLVDGTPSGCKGIRTLNTQFLAVGDDWHLLLDEQPDTFHAWLMATVKLLVESKDRAATLRLRCAQLRPYMSERHYMMTYQHLQNMFYDELGIQM
eukprot:TRINITY_DN102481_c0_g1_i1.p1 TRINITY_DN102481_c0_g1~~TRINITY_DN102481_c0_g1_i1.p1  ORF type:complete len:564 (-),score=57.07 TRINITY_DN102481_c0_g1_i1:183-1874(-)